MFTSCQIQGAFISCTRLIGQTLGQIYISIFYWCQKCNVKKLEANFRFLGTIYFGIYSDKKIVLNYLKISHWSGNKIYGIKKYIFS